MEDLIKKVATEAGISEFQSRKAIECVSAYVKERLPSIVQSQIDPILAGKHWDEALRDKAGALGDEVRNRADGLVDDLKVAFDKTFKKNS